MSSIRLFHAWPFLAFLATIAAVPICARAKHAAPGTKIVLFSGKQSEVSDNWLTGDEKGPAAWKVQDGGSMLVGPGDIVTKERFTDYQLHVEFKVPLMED